MLHEKKLRYPQATHDELQKLANMTDNGNTTALIRWMIEFSLKTLDANTIRIIRLEDQTKG